MKIHKTITKIFFTMFIMLIIVVSACIFPIKDFNIEDDSLRIVKDSGAIVMAMGEFNDYTIKNNKALNGFLKDKAKSLGIINVNKELQLSAVHDSVLGKVYRMQQYYDGYKVYGRELSVTVNFSGKPLNINGNYLPNIKPNNSIELSENDVKSKLYNYEVYSIELAVFSLNQLSPCYAYVAQSSLDGGSASIYDAESGILIERMKSEYNVVTRQTNALGQAVDIDVYSENGYYVLHDDVRNITVYDYSKNDSKGSPAYKWQEGKQLSDNIAISVYDYLVSSYDFYADAENIGVSRKGIADDHDNIAGNQSARGEYDLSAFVHYYPNGQSTQYENASYTDYLRQNFGEVAIGDGRQGGLYQLGKALDVLSHEYQHGITSRTAKLRYLNQAGAINEAVSDIFAVLICEESLDDPNSWLIGEQIMTNGDLALRNMMNPESLGNPSIYNGEFYQPECYAMHDHNSARCDYGGVHTNSNVINSIAYKIYQSDTAFYTKQRLATLWYNTLLTLPSDCNFDTLSINLLQTAKNLNYDSTHLNSILSVFKSADINSYASIEFKNDSADIIGGLPAVIDCSSMKTFRLPQSMMTKVGHTLIGWGERNSSREFIKIYYFDRDYTVPSRNITLYPVMAISAMDDEALTAISGEGSVTSPYIISTAQELMSLAYYINNLDVLEQFPINNFRYSNNTLGNFRLGADIDMSQIRGYFVPINLKDFDKPIFFDGMGYKIMGVNILADARNPIANNAYVGVFHSVYGRISGLELDIKITADDNKSRIIGGLAGYSEAMISSVSASVDISVASVSGYSVVVGGLIGSSNNIIQDSIVRGVVNASTQSSIVGGIIGNWLDNSLKVNVGSDGQGNIIGRAMPTLINNSLSKADLSGGTVGGIIGELRYGKIVNVISTGNISASKYGGGAIGIVTDWWQSTDKVTSVNDAMKVVNADIYIIGTHALGEISGDTRGSMVGGYDKSGYAIILEKSYTPNLTYDIIGTGQNNIIKGAVLSSDDINYTQEQTYTDMNNFATVGQGTPFAMGTMWYMVNNELTLNTKVDSWIDNASESYEGSGTLLSPYIIDSANDLALIAKQYRDGEYLINSKVIYFKQTKDIDLSGKLWQSIGCDLGRSNKERNANINYDGNGYAIRNMVAREKTFMLNRYGKDIIATAYGALVHGKLSTIHKLNVVDCNNSGKLAAGIAISAGKALYCKVSGNISSQDEGGGIAVSISEGLYNSVNASIGGAKVGGIAYNVDLNLLSNYVKANIIVADGNNLAQNCGGGLVGMTLTNTSVGQTNILNNSADIEMLSLSRITNLGGAIGTVSDGAKASFTMQKNVIESRITMIFDGEKYNSSGALVGGGNMFTSLVSGDIFSAKIANNGYISNMQAIGDRTNIDIKASLADVNSTIEDYDGGDIESLILTIVQDSHAKIIQSAILNNRHVAYIVKDNVVVDVKELVDGRFIFADMGLAPQGDKMLYWCLIGEDKDIQGEIFHDDIFVRQKMESENINNDCTPPDNESENVSKIEIIVYSVVGGCLGVMFIALLVMFIIKNNKKKKGKSLL